MSAANSPSPSTPEPWLRGTLTDADPITRAVLHAFELAEEDAVKWCANLSDEEINARPHGIAPVAFHLRHIARSLDRLLTYAEGAQLDATQMTALKSELDAGATAEGVMAEFKRGLHSATIRVRAFAPEHFDSPRSVGRAMLPTTVGGLLVHCADHTQRHIGQAVTTAKIVMTMRSQ
jgi:uncharacterized damage-inducible protein DinB